MMRKLIVLVLILCALASYTARAQTEEPTAVATSQPLTLVWQTDITPQTALPSASDMVVDGKGNIFISYEGLKHVMSFDADGKFTAQWGPDGKNDGQFNDSEGIAIDSQGNIYVADFFNTRIQKFDSSRKFLMNFATEPPSGPGSVAVDKEGNVYALNFGTHDHYIQKFDPSGKLLTEWGTTGSDDGQIGAAKTTGPFDIAIDQDGNVYVTDRENHRIEKYDSDGKFLATFGGVSSTKGNGQFFALGRMALDMQGNLYVLDSFFLQELDPNGKFIAQWPTQGGPLDQASTIGADWQGNIYVTALPAKAPTGMRNIPALKKFAR